MLPVPTLSEADSKALLAGFGLPVLPERVVVDAEAAVAAAEELVYPVVVKLCGDQIAHKTERGLVRLALADAEAVAGRRPSCWPRPGPRTARWGCWWRPWCRATAS